MKKNGKTLMVAGIAAGIAAAAVPAAVNMLSSKNSTEPALRLEKILCNGQCFQTQNGENIRLRILSVRNYTLSIEEREKLFLRFGAYGMAQLAREYEKAMLTDKDLAYIACLGFNCVSVSFSYTLIYPNGKIGKSPDFTALDELINKCCKSGLYVVLNLTDARTFAKKEKPEKALIKTWELIAARYKSDSAVALYDLTAPGLEQTFFSSAVKAIRKSDFEKDIIAPVNSGVKFTYSSNPADKTLIYAEPATRLDSVKAAFNNGFSVAFEPFKSQTASLFTLEAGNIDISVDSYEELLKKYSAINSGAVENKVLADGFKTLFESEAPVKSEAETDGKRKLHFNLELRRGTKLTEISR